MPDLRWFEYHCNESHDSPDAPVWYRSHQQVTVLSHTPSEDAPTTPDIYRVRFADGLEWDVWADELVDGPDSFERPDPPSLPTDTTT